MPDPHPYARRLREIADALEAEAHPATEPWEIHPQTRELLSQRNTTRTQFNYAVPDALQLQRRIRRYNADHGTPHGDVVAATLDTFLRAMGYPPEPPTRPEAGQ